MSNSNAVENLYKAAKAVLDWHEGTYFGGYSPYECTYCECSLWDQYDHETQDYLYLPVKHYLDCEYLTLRNAVDDYENALTVEAFTNV